MKKHSFGFAGFRHSHVIQLYRSAVAHARIDVTGACEENSAAREQWAKDAGINFTAGTLDEIIESDANDVVAIGDVYAARGDLAIRALRAGKHVVADKPLCTSMDELAEIEALAKEKKLAVGCMFDLRTLPAIQTLRQIVADGEIGEVVTLTILAQHPLLRQTRPGWYFEPGQHGGTLNDIAIHATDFLPWLTGQRPSAVTFGRSWNKKAADSPHFKDCAQGSIRLENGGGVLLDVSYLAPDRTGYGIPMYWRITCHGTNGIAETHALGKTVTVAADSDAEVRTIEARQISERTYLDDFLDDVEGSPNLDGVHTADVIEAQRWALRLQEAADRGD